MESVIRDCYYEFGLFQRDVKREKGKIQNAVRIQSFSPNGDAVPVDESRPLDVSNLCTLP